MTPEEKKNLLIQKTAAGIRAMRCKPDAFLLFEDGDEHKAYSFPLKILEIPVYRGWRLSNLSTIHVPLTPLWLENFPDVSPAVLREKFELAYIQYST